MKKKLTNPAALLAMGIILMAPSIARANLLVLTPETLMHAQVADALALEGYAGPDFSTILEYDYTFDTGTGDFSYSLLPGQYYLGQAISLSGTGSYTPSTTTFNWTNSGAIGSEAWSGAGDMQWSGDPTANINVLVTIAGQNYVVKGTVDVFDEPDNTATSSGNLTLSAKGNTVTIPVTDTWKLNNKSATWTVTSPNPPISGGTITWKQGVARATYTPPPKPGAIPEPGTLLLGILGASILMLRRKHPARR